jgi:hypothetical protein
MSYYTWQQIIDKHNALEPIEKSQERESPTLPTLVELSLGVTKRREKVEAEKRKNLSPVLDLFDFTPLTESEVKFENGLKILSQLASTYHPA